MGLDFCEKCGSVLVPVALGEKHFVFCKNCDSVKKADKNLISKEKIIHAEPKGEGVSKEENSFADYPSICPKCGYDKAEIIDIGVLISDEDNLFFIKCGKCGHVDRVGRKTS